MRAVREDDKEMVLEYLRKGLQDCLYLYVDVMNYGIASDYMKLWIEDGQGEISLIVMKYHDSFQIYSHRDDCDISGVLELLYQYPVTMISGRRDIVQRLKAELKNYKAEYGVVYRMEGYRITKKTEKIQVATQEDVREIAELICSDDELGGHYTVDDLAAQLAERIRTRTGRSHIIRENGEIAAHNATYAEAEGIAIVSGTIIKQEYRNTNCYILISNYLIQELMNEGKTVYTFSLSEKMIKYLDKWHTRCSEYGKLVKIE